MSVWRRWLATLMLAASAMFALTWAANAETRSLKLYFLHTGEKAEITFKRNGRYDQSGLRELNRFLRDWRRNEPTKMDPRLFDLIWEAYKATGSNGYINVVSGYRSPATNSMLRSRSRGVAKKSQHMLGKAMDFFIPGVNLKKLRNIGLKMQGGGVGYYPTSGSPFVHFDVGNVRHWPKISRRELVSVFPNGKTLHVPSDGKPLPGYNQALAAYQKRKKSGETAIALAGSSSSSRSGGLLSALFGGGADDEEDSAEAKSAPAPKAPPKAVASKPDEQIRIVPPDQAKPAETIIAALPSRNVPLPALAPRPKRDVGAPLIDLAASTSPLIDLSKDAAKKDAEQSPYQGTEVALAVPLPTDRPEFASATGLNLPTTDSYTVASAEPTTVNEVLAGGDVPLPSLRPRAAEAAFAVAALPDSVEVTAYASPETPAQSTAFPSAPDEIVGQPKGARLVSPKGTTSRVVASNGASEKATLRAALANREPGSDPASVLRSSVKTTKKSARPSRGDTKPDPRPVIVAAQPQAARWALDGNYVKNNTKGTTAPSFAYQIVRSAPHEIYTVGFQQDDQQIASANRFSGKAVTFLTVARFN